MYDDNREVVEPLNEPGVDGKGLIVRGRHFVVLDNIDNSTFYHRLLGEVLMIKEFPLFINDTGDPKEYIQNFTTNVSFILASIAHNIIMAHVFSRSELPRHGDLANF